MSLFRIAQVWMLCSQIGHQPARAEADWHDGRETADKENDRDNPPAHSRFFSSAGPEPRPAELLSGRPGAMQESIFRQD